LSSFITLRLVAVRREEQEREVLGKREQRRWSSAAATEIDAGIEDWDEDM
jgi:hypothetical protein